MIQNMVPVVARAAASAGAGVAAGFRQLKTGSFLMLGAEAADDAVHAVSSWGTSHANESPGVQALSG